MLGFYQFLIWFFTIVSLIALVYGVLEANITYICLFIASLVVSVVFYRLDETSVKDNEKPSVGKSFSLEGIDLENDEIVAATECFRLEQTKLLADLKSRIYLDKKLPNLKEIKIEIIKNFINTLTIKYELTSKQELQDVLIRLFSDLEKKNTNFLFDPNFFPSDKKSYTDWTKRSLILLGWNLKLVEYPMENFFSSVFERSGLLVGLTASLELKSDKLNLEQHKHFIKNGSVDFSVFVTPVEQKNLRELFEGEDKILLMDHKQLTNLPSKLKEMI